jgi:uncharacterized protein (DUF433 family)
MTMANWDNCPAVERVPGWLGGAWVFADTRQPLFSLYEHLAAGETMKNFVEWYGVAKWKVEAVLNHEAKELRKARLTDEENRSVSLAADDTKAEREIEQVIPDNMRNDAGEYICPRHKATLRKCDWPSVLRSGVPVYFCPSKDDGPWCTLCISPRIGVIRPVGDKRGNIIPDELYPIVMAVANAVRNSDSGASMP